MAYKQETDATMDASLRNGPETDQTSHSDTRDSDNRTTIRSPRNSERSRVGSVRKTAPITAEFGSEYWLP